MATIIHCSFGCRCFLSSIIVRGKPVRTAADASMPPDEALKLLREGNARFIKGEPQATRTNKAMRKQLVDMGQAPHTAIIGCADSRAPLETIFDTMPGDIFVLRNAGNTWGFGGRWIWHVGVCLPQASR